MNKLYTHPLLGDLLDNGDIDYAILDILEELVKNKKKTLSISTEYAVQEFMKENIIRALLDLNIVFKFKYYSEMNVEHFLYFEVMARFVQEKKLQMNGYEKLRYKAYKKVKGMKLGSKFSGVPAASRILDKNEIYPKKSYIWGEIGNIYFSLPEPHEAYKESFI